MPRRYPTLGVLALCTVIVGGTSIATVPTPLYPIYVREVGLDAVGITATFAAFAAGAVLGLTIALALSRRLSRRRAFTIAAVLQAASAFLLAADLGLPGFAVGRVVTGLGAGLLAASGTAFVMELAAGLERRPAAILRTIAPALAFIGLGAGPVIAAVSAPVHLAGVRATFLGIGVVVSMMLVLTLSLLPRSAGGSTPGVIPGRRPPLAWSSGLGAFGAFMTTGLFGSVTTVLLADLGVHDAVHAGAFAAAVFLAGAVGVVLLAPRIPLVAAAIALAAALVLVGVAVSALSVVLLSVAAAAAGLASGALFGSSLRRAVAAAPAHAFALTVAVFLCAYTGLAVPVLGFGFVARAAGTAVAVWAFVVLGMGVCGAAALAAGLASRHPAAQAPVRAEEPSLR